MTTVDYNHGTWQATCQAVARGIRKRTLEHTIVHGGYLCQACSSADIFAYLYTRAMNLGPSLGPALPPPYEGWKENKSERVSGMLYNGGRAADKDRFFISPTHYALVAYTTLIETGRMDPAALNQFNRDGSRVEMIGGERSPGHEVNGGSFGQAISQAAGVAWARKAKGDTGRVYIFLGDGELQEGQTWEAVMSMADQRLDNITVFIDVNGQQVDGRTADVMTLEPLTDKFKAFGWHVCKVDGHDLDAMEAAHQEAHEGKPKVILAYTSPITGVPLLKQRWPNLHYIRFRSEAERDDYRQALKTM